MKYLAITLVFFFLQSNSLATAQPKYLSAVKEVIQEIRPHPLMDDIDKFLKTAPLIKPDQTAEKSVKQIIDFIFNDLKISADNSYQSRNNRDNILPDSVLKTKQGHCVGLTILFLLIAEKNELKVSFVRGPDHVFPRLCDKSKCLNVEMLKKGEIKEDDYYIKNLLISKDALDKKLYLVSIESPQELKASIYLGLGFVANKAGQKDLAELFYLKATQNSENFVEPHSNLAAIYADSGRVNEALSELKRALAMNPSHYASLINLGVIEHSRGKEESALDYYSKAIVANPLSMEAYRRRSRVYEIQKEWTKASLDLERILIIEPRFCDVLEDRIKLATKEAKLSKPELPIQLKRLKTGNQCLSLPRS